jgi:hypothetical protein
MSCFDASAMSMLKTIISAADLAAVSPAYYKHRPQMCSMRK